MTRYGNNNGNGRGRILQRVRCAIYTRKSTEEGLEQEFNSLDAQREAGAAYIASQKAEGWVELPDLYDDGGYTGANMDRPGVKRLFDDIEAGRVDCVVVYKVDRLSRSLMDFARMMESFEKYKVSFVSVTQHFNTTHSMGRLTLNILLSFAQFEREIISERTRDKIAAARRKGKWSGGRPILGYDVTPESKLVVNAAEAVQVRAIFELYLETQSLIKTVTALNQRGWTTKHWKTRKGPERGGRAFDKSGLRGLLTNVAYLGRVKYKDEVHKGEHEAIVDEALWQRAQLMMRSNGRSGGMHIRNKYGSLLKGLLYCRPCGLGMAHTYTVRGGNRCYRYYVCYTAQKKGWDACPSKSLPAEEIERFVVQQIRAIGKDPEIMALALEQARGRHDEEVAATEGEARIVEREVGQLQREIAATATDAATNGHAAARLADLHERLRDAERRWTELCDKIARAQRQMVTKADVDSALEAFEPLWETLSPKEQARILQLLVQRVDYDGASGKVAVTFRANGIKTLGPAGARKAMEESPCLTV